MTSAANIKKALELQYDTDVANSFLAYIKEEDFDEETLKEDIEDVEVDDLDNCSVVEHLANAFPKEFMPRNVISSVVTDNKEEEEEEDDDEEEIGVDCIANIEHRLDANKVNNAQKEKTKRIFVRHIEQALNERRMRNKRLMIYVDRRNPAYVIGKDECDAYVANNYGMNEEDEETGETLATKMNKQRRSDKKKTWHDTIYFVEAPDELYNTLPSRHSAETSFWASTQCMLPRIKSDPNNENGWGCRNDFNGYQFTLSWHCDTQDTIRCYWFSSCWGTRFFPADAAMLWPQYFNKKGGKVKEEQSKALKQMPQCIDPGFKHWYESTTKNKLIVFA
eukprot:448949_1